MENIELTTEKCKTKYPILLAHGIGYNDVDYPQYWGRIPDALRENGAKVYFGNQDGFGEVKKNAGLLSVEVNMILEAEETDKVNIIAHSKGGIEARYMISNLGMEDHVASLTTMATPHRGIATLDELKDNNPGLLNRLYSLFNVMLRVDGGESPDDNSVYDQLTEDYMHIFNAMVPDSDKVYYQSYAFDMVDKKSDPALGLFHKLIEKNHGPNDGLVPVSSAKWGNFRGVYKGPEGKGVSHPAACDGRVSLTEKRGLGNITELYVDIVSELREMGF